MKLKIKKELLIAYLLLFNLMLGFKLISSFLPIYLNVIGVSLAGIGIVYAFGAIAAGMIRIPIGSFIDSKGRKKLMLLGILAYPLFAVGLSLSKTFSQFVTLNVFIELFGAIFWTAFTAYLFDILSRGKEGVQIAGKNSVMFSTGALAPAIGGIVIAQFGFVNLFYLAAIVSAIAIPLALSIKDDKMKKKKWNVNAMKKEYLDILKIKGFKTILSIGLLHNFIWGVWFVYMPIYLTKIGISIPLIGALLAANMAVGAVLQFPLGRAIDKLPVKYLIIPGFFIVWVGGYFFLLAQEYFAIVASRITMGFGWDSEFWPSVARLVHRTPKREHGGVWAALTAGMAFSFSFSTVVAGYIADWYGIKTVLMSASVLALIAAFVLASNKELDEKGKLKLKKHHHIYGSHHHHK